MLRRLLAELAAGDGPVDAAELARRLDVDRSAVEGMLDELVRLGRLEPLVDGAPVCHDAEAHGCGSSCDPATCPFPTRLPLAYRIRPPERTGTRA